MTQAQQLLDYMRRHGAVTAKEIRDQLGISNAIGRVWDIKKGIGCEKHVVQSDRIETLNRDGEVCLVKRWWLDGTPPPPPGAPVVARRRRTANQEARLRGILERRRQRIKDLEERLADAEALAKATGNDLEQIVEDRRRTKSVAIRAGLAAGGPVQPALFPLGGLS